MPVTSTIVTQYYTAIFRQAPSAAVSTAYQAMADNSAALNSMLSAANVSVDPVVRLYQTAFNRLPDTNGMTAWTVPFSTGAITLQQIANGFTTSTEFTTLYPTSMTNSQFVGALYYNILQRQGEDAGIKGWVDALNKGALTRAQVLLGFSESGEFTKNIEPAVNTFLTNIANTALANQGAALLYTGSLFDLGGAPTATYTLTTGVDAPGVGAFATSSPSGNSVINGTMVYAAAGVTVDATSTLNVSDVIQGTGSNNTLSLTVSGGNNTTTFVGASISGIQTINVRNVSGNENQLDASTVSGLTAFNSNLSSSGAVTVTNLASGAVAGVIGNGSVTNTASNFGWAAAVTTASMNLRGGVTAGAITLSGAALATQTINSLGASNTIGALALAATTTSLTINATSALTTGAVTNTGAAALTSLTITGAGAVNLSATALEATVTTVNASGNSGGVTVALGSSTTQVVTGGTGNDVITTGSVLTTGSVNAGDGTADVLNVGTNVAHVNTTALAAKYTNFESIRVNGTLDMSLFPAITAIQLSGATNSITNMTATQAANVTARANIGATTLTLATATGTSDVLTITAGLGTTTAAATTIGVLTATGFETINLVANPGPTATTGANRTSTITSITDTSLTAVNLTGTSWTVSDISSTKAVTWTATGLTGNGASTPVGLTISATGTAAAGSVVNGSDLRDSITMDSSTGVTFNLNGGNDQFSTTTALLTPTGAATDNTVNGGAGTSDQLIFTGAATATDTTFTKVSGFESLQLAGGAVANSVTGLAAGFLSAFATGVTVTDAATQTGANAYTWASGLYGQNVTLTHATTYDGGTAGTNQSVTTGAGTDTVTITAAAFVGVTGADGGQISVSTGAGNDTIVVTTGTLLNQTTTQAVSIRGGTGADVITITHVNAAATLGNAAFIVALGDSTTTAYDQITGFKMSDIGGVGGLISDGIDFAAARLAAYVATAATGYTAAELTVAVSAAGAVTFAGTAASGLTLAQKISAIQSVVTGTNGDSAFIVDSGNTYVFNNNSGGDSVVMLVGVSASALITTNDNTTDNGVFIF